MELDKKESNLSIDSNENSSSLVSFSLVHKKVKFQYSLPRETTVGKFKDMVFEATKVPKNYQKLFCDNKTLENDDLTLSQLKLHPINPKILLMGSISTDIEKTQAALSGKDIDQVNSRNRSNDNVISLKWFEEDIHKRVLEKNSKSEDYDPEVLNLMIDDTSFESILFKLINSPISGMIDKRGEKLRITVKSDIGQLWLSTKDRTNKVAISTIRKVDSHPIETDKDFSVMYIQLGPTEKSRYFIYYIPTKICEPLKELLLQGNRLATL